MVSADRSSNNSSSGSAHDSHNITIVEAAVTAAGTTKTVVAVTMVAAVAAAGVWVMYRCSMLHVYYQCVMCSSSSGCGGSLRDVIIANHTICLSVYKNIKQGTMLCCSLNKHC